MNCYNSSSHICALLLTCLKLDRCDAFGSRSDGYWPCINLKCTTAVRKNARNKLLRYRAFNYFVVITATVADLLIESYNITAKTVTSQIDIYCHTTHCHNLRGLCRLSVDEV
uniref:Intron-encoded endonuclease I-PpoI n=1 Tax=Lygus hesperus TaxID=30085 RepID=A0A0A9XXW7_LYGHE